MATPNEFFAWPEVSASDFLLDLGQLHIFRFHRNELPKIIIAEHGVLRAANETVEFCFCVFDASDRFEKSLWIDNSPRNKDRHDDISFIFRQRFRKPDLVEIQSSIEVIYFFDRPRPFQRTAPAFE